MLTKATGQLADALKNLNGEALKLEDGDRQSKSQGFNGLGNSLHGLMNLLQESDMPVTTQATQAVMQAEITFNQLNLKFIGLTGSSLKALNAGLAKAGLDEITL